MKRFAKNISVYVVLFIVVLIIATQYQDAANQGITVSEVPFSEFVQMAMTEDFSAVEIDGTKITGQLSETSIVYAYAPSITQINWLDVSYLMPQVEAGTLEYKGLKPDNGSILLNLLPNIIMIAALGFLFYIMMNQGGNGKAGG